MFIHLHIFGFLTRFLTSICFVLFATAKKALRQIVHEQRASIRWIYASLLLATLVLSTFYSCSIFSILTLPRFESPVDTIADIERIAVTDSHSLIMRHNSMIADTFKKAKAEHNKLYHLIGQHLLR